jgi:hypothetical protein
MRIAIPGIGFVTFIQTAAMYNNLYSHGSRIRFHAGENIDLAIDRMIGENIHYYRTEPAHIIQQRIYDLDNEWHIEKILELGTSGLAITGILLSLAAGKKWLLLTVISSLLLAQHALKGWCPPYSLLRKYMIRTRKEIEKEKHGLIEVLKNMDSKRFLPSMDI